MAMLTGAAVCNANTTIEIHVEIGMYLTVMCANTSRLRTKNDYTYH
jgi:hypothetical protein